ncbi:MAG: hypothetical protein JW803_07310 [Endomicrobiales bacterium]|nr:hypothetical protein [Endomicrobiales bacterium]
MDEFKDLDSEIEKLKSELAASEELSKKVKFPASGDYWKNRLDEERSLWEKKISFWNDEKKSLETKLESQQTQISQYKQNIESIEKRLEAETKEWEVRLHVKEADLMVEKNRILSESKVNEVERENKSLLERISELHQRVAALREENKLETEKLNEHAAREKEAYEEKFKANMANIEVLEARIKELETTLSARAVELEETKKELTQKAQKAEQISSQLSKEKVSLSEELIRTRETLQEDKEKIQLSLKHDAIGYVEKIRDCIGPLAGLAQFFSRNKPHKTTWNAFKELIQRTDAETDVFLAKIAVPSIEKESFDVVMYLPDEDAAFWESSLFSLKSKIIRTNEENVIKDVSENKPRFAVVSSAYLSTARKINRKWPFIPVVVYGTVDKRTAAALAAKGLAVVATPCSPEDIVNSVNTIAKNSVSRPELWGKIKTGIPSLAYVLLAAALFLAIAGYYNGDTIASYVSKKPVSYATPYAQPTNLSSDGKNLWICDWFGQGIYKHTANGGLKLVKIYNFPGKHFTALAWSGGSLWTIDAWEQKIYRHNTDGGLKISETYGAPGASPSGISGNGSVIWTCDSQDAVIYQHAMDKNLTVTSIIDSPGPSPSGLFYDGEFLWSTDSMTNNIYCHKTDPELTVIRKYIAPQYDQKGFNLSGLVMDKKYLWVCSEKLGKVFRYPKKMLKELK